MLDAFCHRVSALAIQMCHSTVAVSCCCLVPDASKTVQATAAQSAHFKPCSWSVTVCNYLQQNLCRRGAWFLEVVSSLFIYLACRVEVVSLACSTGLAQLHAIRQGTCREGHSRRPNTTLLTRNYCLFQHILLLTMHKVLSLINSSKPKARLQQAKALLQHREELSYSFM